MPKAVPLYGLGAEAPPTFGQTTDDVKLGLFAGAVASGVNTFQEAFGPTMLRKSERDSLAPNFVKAQRRQTTNYQPTSEFEESIVTSFRHSQAPRDVGRTFSAEEATKYNQDMGLSYKVPQSKAQLDWDRNNYLERMRRESQIARIQDGFFPKTFAFGGGLAGALADPSNVVLMALPSATQIRAGKAALQAGKGLKTSQTALKAGTLIEVPAVAPAIKGAIAKDFGIAFVEGMTVDSLIEIPNYILTNQLQEEYTMESLIFSTLAGGAFSGVIQGGLGALTRRSINDGLMAEHSKLVRTHMQLEEALRGEGVGLYNGLALLDAEARIEVRAIIAKALSEGGELGEALDQARFRPDGLGTTVPLGPIAFEEPPSVGNTGIIAGGRPRVRVEEFTKLMQRGLDHDIYFGAMVDEPTFKAEVEAAIKAEKPNQTAKERRAERRKKKLKKQKELNAERRQYAKMKDRYLDFEEGEEMLEGMLEGGLWRVQDLDELEPHPAAKPRVMDAEDVFESSKKLDELADEVGILELKALDRSKHIMKSVEMRIKVTKTALADMLAGREVNTDFLVREGVLFDLHNRGRISEQEFMEQMKNLAEEYKLELEGVDNYGIFRDKESPISEEQMAKNYKDASAKDLEEEAEALTRFLDDDVVDDIPEELLDSPQFRAAEQAYHQIDETSKLLKGDKAKEGIENLAACMAKIGNK
jgi:hypothetical protein